MEHEKYLIKRFKHWEVHLHKNQCYLGRTYLWARREDAVDFIDMTRAEREEFFRVGKQVNKVLEEVFAPDLMNYAALGNTSRHLHMHFIPRYESPREFADMVFTDDRWGKNYAPYDYDFEIPEKVLLQIRDVLRERFPEDA